MNLLTRVDWAVKNERNAAAALIVLLVEVDKTMLYAEMGYSSVLEFLVKHYRYSESSAWRRVQAMRLYKENKVVVEKIKSGELSLSNAAKVHSIQRAAQKQKIELPKAELFQAALNSSTREAEKKFAEIVAPLGLVIKTKREDFRELIEEVKAAHSHALPDQSDDALFKHLLQKESARLKAQGSTGRGKTESTSRQIPTQVKRAVKERDESCTYVDPKSGRRCGAKHFVQQHHRIAFAQGGPTTEQNLTLHCWAHNQLQARKEGLSSR